MVAAALHRLQRFVQRLRSLDPLPVLSISSLKPPIVPSPFTAGGGKTPMNASLIAPVEQPHELARHRWAVQVGLLVRSSNGFSAINTIPALELLENPAIDNPETQSHSRYPGCFSAMISAIVRITFSVRSSELPGGSCSKRHQVLLGPASECNPVGTRMNNSPAQADQRQVHQQAQPPDRVNALRTPPVVRSHYP